MELGLCSRVTLSAVLTLMISHLLNLRLALWAVLTAVILTQMNVGRSLKATTDYLLGTLGGAIYAGAVGALVPHNSEIALSGALAIALAPVALVAATNARFSAGPFTAVMVFLAPTITHLGPIASAFERVIEVAVGGFVGLAVSFMIFPARAYDLAIDTAGRVLNLMAQLLPELFGGLAQSVDEATMRGIQDKIGAAIAHLDGIAVEGRHERMTRLAAEPDQAPLLRTLLRLRHDFVMIGRTAVVPLPDAFQARLGPALARVSETAADYLRANGAALVAHQRPAPRRDVETALQSYAAEMAVLRDQSLMRDFPVDAVERMFALGFALEQLRRNFNDLERCIAEISGRTDRNEPQPPARV
ncbi:MAG: hypothetical protein QOJ15_9671 [Bradyrhizobium sp.]|nr:hypothetical protein [Bradyrhizobium sp.]